MKNLIYIDFFMFNKLFWTFNLLFRSFYWLILIFLLKIDQKWLNLIKKRSKIDRNCDQGYDFDIDFEWDRYRRSNSDGLESELSMIQFGSPNGLSLHHTVGRLWEKTVIGIWSLNSQAFNFEKSVSIWLEPKSCFEAEIGLWGFFR